METLLKTLLSIGIMLLISFNVIGQQQTIYSNYFYNKVLVNPAYTGLEEIATASATIKRSWVGLEGAPTSQILTAHLPLVEKNAAFGFIAANDQVGVVTETNLQFIGSYRIYLKDHILSFGIQPSITIVNQQLSELRGIDPNDPSFNGDDVNAASFNLGFGSYLTHQKYYVGATVNRIRSGLIKRTESQIGSIENAAQISLHGGFIMNLSPSLKFQPNLLIRHINGIPLQVDLNATTILKERIITGLSLHSLHILEGNFGFLINKNLTCIYSFGFATEFNEEVNRSSHELTVQYSFRRLLSRHISTRYF